LRQEAPRCEELVVGYDSPEVTPEAPRDLPLRPWP